MKNLVVVIAIVSVFTAGLSAIVTCFFLRDMASAARKQRSVASCVDSVKIIDSRNGEEACPSPDHKIEAWPAEHGWVLVKCLCPHQGAK